MHTFRHVLPLAATFLCAQAWAANVTPVWTDSFDPLVGDSSAGHVVALGDIAYVAGAGPFKGTPSSNADIRVRAYAIKSGSLLWEDLWDAGGMHQDDAAADIAAAGTRVYIAGSSATNTSMTALVVRAYDRHNGAILWEDHCGQTSSGAKAIVADSMRVLVVGTCIDGTGDTGIVRAYVAGTGAQLWEARDIALPLAVTLSGDTVVVAGEDAGGALVLHAYGVKHGELRWEAKPAAAQSLSLRSAELAVTHGMTYLAWRAVDANDQATDQIAAYTVSKGRLHWAKDPGDQVRDLALAANRLFAAQQGDQALLSAFDVGQGRLLWRKQLGTPTTPYSALAVTVGGNQAIIAGQAYDPAVDSAPHFMVQAYNYNGHLLWEDETPTTALQGAEAMDVAWSKGIVVASGMDSRTDPPFGTTHWLVRAYATGGGGQPGVRLRSSP
jgi:hypothetical protein